MNIKEITDQTIKSYELDDIFIDIIDQPFCGKCGCTVREVWISRECRTAKMLLYSFQTDRVWSYRQILRDVEKNIGKYIDAYDRLYSADSRGSKTIHALVNDFKIK